MEDTRKHERIDIAMDVDEYEGADGYEYFSTSGPLQKRFKDQSFENNDYCRKKDTTPEAPCGDVMEKFLYKRRYEVVQSSSDDDLSEESDLSELIALKRVKIIDNDSGRRISTNDNNFDFSPINTLLREFEMLRRFRRGLKITSSFDMKSKSLQSPSWDPTNSSGSLNRNTRDFEESVCFPP